MLGILHHHLISSPYNLGRYIPKVNIPHHESLQSTVKPLLSTFQRHQYNPQQMAVSEDLMAFPAVRTLKVGEILHDPQDGDLHHLCHTDGLSDVLNEFLSGLPEDTRFIFMRRYYFADDVGTISEITGLGKNTVSARLMRARKRLAEILKEKGYKI